jgi:hypothetical protein
MEQIVIQVKDKTKAKALMNFLKSLEFVDAVSSADLPLADDNPQNRDAAFFALAGLWADRDVTLESIRRKAWPEQA